MKKRAVNSELKRLEKEIKKLTAKYHKLVLAEARKITKIKLREPK